MTNSDTLPRAKPTAAYIGGRTIRAAPLLCPYCQHGLNAHDFEAIDSSNVRAVCSACGRDLLTIEM